MAGTAVDGELQSALDALAVPGLLIGHRIIATGDERFLLAQEGASIRSDSADVRRASGSARIVARGLLSSLGYHGAAIPKGLSGEPGWPPGIVGSLAHDERVAVAAVARVSDIPAVGIDVEPAVALPSDMLALIEAPQDFPDMLAGPLQGRLLFAAKEAVFKAIYPRDRVFLEFSDIRVNFQTRQATTATGCTVRIRYCLSSHIVVVAWS